MKRRDEVCFGMCSGCLVSPDFQTRGSTARWDDRWHAEKTLKIADYEKLPVQESPISDKAALLRISDELSVFSIPEYLQYRLPPQVSIPEKLKC